MFLEGFHGFWQKVAEPEKVSAESEVKFLAAQKLNFGHWSLKKCFWRLQISVSGDLEPEEIFLADIWPAGLSAVEPKKVSAGSEERFLAAYRGKNPENRAPGQKLFRTPCCIRCNDIP